VFSPEKLDYYKQVDGNDNDDYHNTNNNDHAFATFESTNYQDDNDSNQEAIADKYDIDQSQPRA
jgi:hypothetical protein